MPALLRARRRFRPRGPRDARGPRRRRVDRERPEGVEHAGARRRPRHARRPHRPRHPEAQGPHLLHGRHARARCRSAAAAADHRRGRVQRGVPHRRAHRRRRSHRRRRRRLARLDDDAHERAHDHRRRHEQRDTPGDRDHRSDRPVVEAHGSRSCAARPHRAAVDRLRGVAHHESARPPRTARSATPARRARLPSWRSPPSTRAATSSASTCWDPKDSLATTTRSAGPTRPASTRRSGRRARCSCGRARTRSRAGRRRSCATSSASASSASPANRGSTATFRGRKYRAADGRPRRRRCVGRRVRARVADGGHRTAGRAVHRRCNIRHGSVRGTRARPRSDRRAAGIASARVPTSRSR